ncbi:hypothetical protein SDC9_162182 [bioreactor metagenome]|uniref:Uncharacterized protein n=1 Tax=bioreactor metagenome TaxID=1076179 RepID=A0A645FRS2_9ZZZZ
MKKHQILFGNAAFIKDIQVDRPDFKILNAVLFQRFQNIVHALCFHAYLSVKLFWSRDQSFIHKALNILSVFFNRTVAWKEKYFIFIAID